MKRRTFLASAGAAGTALGLTGCEEKTATVSKQTADTPTLAGTSLGELRDSYYRYLFDDYLPFCDKYVIDHEHGGFMCNTDRDGTNLSTNKRGWYEGRGIWVYSFLYRNFTKDQAHLDVATKSVEFIMKNKPPKGELWPEQYDRTGKPIGEPDKRGYGNLFIANGLAEYARATGDDKWWNLAKVIMLDFVTYFDRPDYHPDAARNYLGANAPLMPGARILGVWMVLTRLTTQMLEHKDDADLKAVNDRAIEAIMRHHFSPEFDLILELVNHDMTRPENDLSQFSYIGHAIETLWMVMYEAVRRRDKELFYTAGEWFKRHTEVAWDDVYGGVFAGIRNIGNNDFILNKVLWAQEEVLVGTMCLVEHLEDAWAREWYGKMWAYVLDKFPLQKHGQALWILSADRKVTYQPHAARVGNFHHPRHLMLNMLSLDRMIERNGQPSGLFA